MSLSPYPCVSAAAVLGLMVILKESTDGDHALSWLIPCANHHLNLQERDLCGKQWLLCQEMGKCLQLDFSYKKKADNSIFFSLFRLISF